MNTTTTIPPQYQSAVLKLTHRFSVPRERVFAAFSSYENMAAWFGPEGCHVVSGHADFREGGTYLLNMETPNGVLAVGGTYRKIAAPELLEYTWQWKDDEDWTELESLVSLEFHAVENETEVRLTQTGFPNAESFAGHEHGWVGGWASLTKFFMGES